MMLGRLTGTAGLLLALFAVAQPLPLRAQSGTSSALSGTLVDQSGAAIAGAEVKATEVDTGAVRVVQSNGEGRFLFSQVNPGTYRIEARVAGFGPDRKSTRLNSSH